VDVVVDALEGVILVAAAVDVGTIGEGGVGGLAGEEEVGAVVDAGRVSVNVGGRPAAAGGVGGVLEALLGGEVGGADSRAEDVAIERVGDSLGAVGGVDGDGGGG